MKNNKNVIVSQIKQHLVYLLWKKIVLKSFENKNIFTFYFSKCLFYFKFS